MVGDIEVTSEGAELLELHLINYSVFLKGHGELKLAILTSSEVFNSPLNAAFRNVKVGPVWVLCYFLRLH